jgi:membrane-bound metal-dependent hydrolase YbcI (DUF457 family)
MDIVTHAAVGLIVASPWLDTRPELAAGLVFCSVLPDLDALSRIFGKRAFLQAHQTVTHSLPGIAVAALGAGFIAQWLGGEAWASALGLAIGMLLHVGMDLSNTFGVAWPAPLNWRRQAFEWVFFVDATMLVLCALTGLWIFLRDRFGLTPSILPTISFLVATGAYWLVKVWLRRRAWTRLPMTTVSLVPSAMVPWRFFGAVREGNQVRLMKVDAWSGSAIRLTEVPVFDSEYQGVLNQLLEFRTLRALSPAYHVVGVEADERGRVIRCRDLRTRNFQTSFGDLTVRLDFQGNILSHELRV